MPYVRPSVRKLKRPGITELRSRYSHISPLVRTSVTVRMRQQPRKGETEKPVRRPREWENTEEQGGGCSEDTVVPSLEPTLGAPRGRSSSANHLGNIHPSCTTETFSSEHWLALSCTGTPFTLVVFFVVFFLLYPFYLSFLSWLIRPAHPVHSVKAVELRK